MTLARHADDDWRLEALEFSGMPYESSLFNAVRLECRMVRDGSANRLLATADEDVFTPEMEEGPARHQEVRRLSWRERRCPFTI